MESEPPQFPVVTAADSSVELTGVTVRQNGTATGVQVEESPVSANGLNVEMVDPAATAPAVDVANEGGASTFCAAWTRPTAHGSAPPCGPSGAT